MSIYTKMGDSGQTDLTADQRVSKADIRIECRGAVDELSAVVGLAKSLSKTSCVREDITWIQTSLGVLSAALAGSETTVDETDVAFLESLIDRYTAQIGGFRGFVTPGHDPGSAALHVARTVARRAERAMVRQTEAGYPLSPSIMGYLNRLSDALFILARFEEEGTGS